MYSIGLIDCLRDDIVIQLMDWIHARLRPGGKVILGNFHPYNPFRAFMDHMIEWELIHRTEDDMHRLFRRSAFGRGCSEIRFERTADQSVCGMREGGLRPPFSAAGQWPHPPVA